jgi:hypothetical protein
MNIMRTLVYVAVCLLTGCLARPPLHKQSFVFAPSSKETPKAAPGSRVLGVRTLQVAAPFEGRPFVYRTGEFSYERDPYAEFMVSPAEELLWPICGGMRAAGVFSAVEEAGSVLKPNTLVEIYVTQLYGDFRQGENPSVVLTMRFEFFDAPNGVPGRAILQREYSSKIPLKERTASALMAGWNEALAQILDSATADFGRVDADAPKS